MVCPAPVGSPLSWQARWRRRFVAVVRSIPDHVNSVAAMRICLVHLLLLALLSGTAKAQSGPAKRQMDFLEALRQRGYFEYAQLYLDDLKKRPDVPAEVKAVVAYQRAITYLEAGRSASGPIEQSANYDKAIGFLDQFVKANPKHELAAAANSQRGRILLGKARVEIWQAQSPANAAKQTQFQAAGRKLVVAARGIFQAAHAQYEKAWKAFPTFIDKVKQKGRFEQRKRAEAVYMRAQYDLALCSYEEAQTWNRGSNEYKKLLTKSSTEFEAIHTRYRSQVLGLYARMWQGKSFEEQDDINKAMGIYKELLDHPGGSQTMRRIQDKVLLFKLICLNHEKKQDHVLVIAESTQWLGKHTTRQRRTPDALGVLWQQVRAREALAATRTVTKQVRDQQLTQAMNSCRFIQRWPSRYKDVALFKLRELQVKLRGSAVEPQDFDTALGIAQDLFKKIKDHNELVAAARRDKKPAAELKKLAVARDEHLASTRDMLQTALSLVERDTAREDLNRARFYLAYVYYQRRQNYEAAVLGDFLSRHAGPKDTAMALDAAAIAMASHVRGYNDSPTDELKQQDLRLIEATAARIISNWPESDRAQDVRLQLAQVYEGKRPLEAARNYAQVTEKARAYAEAQTRAGQQFLRAWLDAANAPQASRPSQQDLDSWVASAERHLKAGIARTEQSTPATVKASELLIAAKVSLAQILNNNGKYQESIDLLVKDPHSVITAVSVDDETKRPEKGVQRREFASLAAQLLLRAWIGLRKLDQAQSAMELLEKIAGAAKGEAVTELYRQLGDELKQELSRLSAAGNQQRVNEVQAAFEEFLDRLRQRSDQTFNSLIWVAETYSGLGQAAVQDQAKANRYFGHAAGSYQSIIDRTEASPMFLRDPKMMPGVKLRLAACYRHQGQFEEARKIIVDLVKASPMALDVQFEAASMYQAWAGSGKAENFDKAVIGVKAEGVLGWSQIALLLQRLIDSGSKDAERYRDRRWEARYNQLQCRLEHAAAVSSESENQLKRARSEIQSMMMVTAITDSRWTARYDAVYRKILEGLNEPVITLAEYRGKYKPKLTPAVAPNKLVPSVAASTGPAAVSGAAAAVSGGGPGLLGLVFAGVLLLAGGVGVVFMLKSGSRSRRSRRRFVPDAAPVPRPAGSETRTRRSAAGKKKPSGGQPSQKSQAADSASRSRRRKPGPKS
ncbi:MAG: hypothetical protein CMJ65_09300 [Planctomycetaceae bacterium]|jgi:hypothetical protein|nr:hypothetical protein [Planctomycetaceae bacterium]